MSDRIQRVMAYLIGMAMVAAVAAAPTVAQVYDPQAERVFEVTANADTVDGFSAIGATANKALRARKLVATNRYGQLPSNIIRPRWRDLKGVPAGFKDGVDHVGVWGVTITQVIGSEVEIPGNDEKLAKANCPTGSVVVGGGGHGSWSNVYLTASEPSGNSWWAAAYNTSGATESVQAFAMCMSVKPAGAITTASRGYQPANRAGR